MGERSYRQDCALAIALDLIGDRWTLLIIRELMLGKRRFRDLLANLPGIGTNLLSNRLKSLTDACLVAQVRNGQGYQLTETGRGLEEVVYSLIRWGMPFTDRRRSAVHARGEWNLLPLRALLDRDQVGRWRGSYRLEIGGEPLIIAMKDGELMAVDDSQPVLATLRMDSVTAARLGAGQLSFEQAESSGLVEVEGLPEDVEALLAAFPAPA